MNQSDCLEALEMFHYPYGFDTTDPELVNPKTKNNEDPELGPTGEFIGKLANEYKQKVDKLIAEYELELDTHIKCSGYEHRMGLISKKEVK